MKTPFGNTVAALKLAELVQDNKPLRKVVGKYITEFNHLLGQVTCIRDIKCKRKTLLIYRSYFFDKIKCDGKLPVNIKNYLRSTMTSYYRGVTKAVELLG